MDDVPPETIELSMVRSQVVSGHMSGHRSGGFDNGIHCFRPAWIGRRRRIIESKILAQKGKTIANFLKAVLKSSSKHPNHIDNH